MLPEEYHITFVISLIGLMILALVTDRFRSSVVFLVVSAALLVAGVLDVETFFHGFSNISILTIFLLIIITAGINEHFNLTGILDRLFKGVRGPRSFIMRMGSGVAALSAFMNNTPVVAMMMPYVYNWGKRHNVSPSKLLMPLSFAAIAGGVVTLIGTSTNLILNGLLIDNGIEPFAFFDFMVPGVIITVLCLLVLVIFSPWILKDRKDLIEVFEENTREYLVETRVLEKSSIIGKTVEEAGLRNLEGVFLTGVVRAKRQITPVSPEEVVQEGDILLFAGETSQIFSLLKKEEGLELSKSSQFNLAEDSEIVETIVSQNSRLDHKNVKQAGFREKFDAAIIGIHRRGEKIRGKIGSVILRTGDLLLLKTGPEFKERNKRQEDMIVINSMPTGTNLPAWRKKLVLISIVGLISLAVMNFLSLFEALLGIGFIQILTGMLNYDLIKRSVSLDLLIILVSALALGNALIDTGAAQLITGSIFQNAGQWGSLTVLLGIFGVTFLLTSLVTNIAAISIIFPVVFSLSSAVSIPSQALFLTAAYGASCCFVTPFAYQTNLMVLELGNYKFSDFLRLGVFVSAVYALSYFAYAVFKFDIL